jgi:hypothetical protein
LTQRALSIALSLRRSVMGKAFEQQVVVELPKILDPEDRHISPDKLGKLKAALALRTGVRAGGIPGNGK